MKPFKWFSLHWNLERTGCGGQRTHASVGQILERHLNSLCSHSFSGELPEGKKNILNKPTHRMESLITAEHGHSNCRTWTHLKHHFYLFCYFETWGAGWGNTQILQCVSFLQHHSSSCVECVYGNRLCIYFNLYNQSPWLKSSRGNIWIFPNNSWCKKNSDETAELQPQYEVQNASYLLEPFADSYSVMKTGICASMCFPPLPTRFEINICKEEKENL